MQFSSLPTRVVQFTRRSANSRNYVWALGLLAGVTLLTACHLFLATLGTALPAVTALAVAMAVGFELAWRPSRRRLTRSALLWWHGTLSVLLAVWGVLLPSMFGMALALAGGISLEVMASPGRAMLFQFLVALATVSPVVYFAVRQLLNTAELLADANDTVAEESTATTGTAPPGRQPTVPGLSMVFFIPRAIGRWILHWRARRRAQAGELRPGDASRFRFQLGAATGLILTVLAFAPLMGLHTTCLIAASLGTVVFLRAWILAYRAPAVQSTPSGIAAQTAVNPAAAPRSRIAVLGNFAWTWAAFAVIGGLTAIVMRMLNQLAATAAWLVYLQWAALLVGLVFGLRAGLRRSESSRGRDELVATTYLLAVVAGCVLLMFAALIDLALWINVLLTVPWLMVGARGLLIATVLVPFGLAWGRLSVASVPDSPEPELPRPHAFAVVAGLLAVRWVALEFAATVDVFVGLTLTLASLALVRWSILRLAMRTDRTAGTLVERIGVWRGRLRRGALTASVVLVLALPWCRSLYDPVRSSRQLFATNVFVARMLGLDGNMLSYLDEGRPVAVVEGDRGTFTVWRYRGTQMQLRENGVPKALVSTDPRLCPHFSAEVMPAVLPLVLHPKPHRVMLLGASGGVSLTTTLAFPVKSVTCVESDSRLLSVLRDQVWSESNENPANDSRLRWVTLEPALAVACGGHSYDVIVSTPDQSALLQSSPYFTRGFYGRVSDRLAVGGIFCQRFNQIDYGAQPLQVVTKTLQQVFLHVGAVEVAAGEIVLLATNSEQGLSRAGVVERFQTPHARAVLSRIGWDWSFPLNLTAYGQDGLKQFAEAGAAQPNTAANGAFAFGLPREVMRWAPKWQELVAAIGPYRTRLLESPTVKSDDRVLLRRLAEITGQRKLLASYPDQWWAYRKLLKTQLKTRPRTLIRQASSGKVGSTIHPEDKRRLRYFRDLSRALRNPTPQTVGRVAAYADPYDPLLSPFAHLEAATLYARCKKRDYRAELWHRLHAAYYAETYDRSVRNVSATLMLLAEREDVVDRPTARWDHLNALLQILKSRWEQRGLIQPRSAQIVLNDIEKTLDAVDASFATMKQLHTVVGISAAAWQARRQVLHRGLVRPLSAYRTQLLRHHHIERERMKALMKKLEKEENDKSKKKKDGKGRNTAESKLRPTAS